MNVYRVHRELERDTKGKALPVEGYDLYVAALCDDVVKFKEILKQSEVQAFLLDPDKGVKNLVLDTRDTLVHSMAMQSAACLRVFLEFCKENIANSQSRERQINDTLLTFISSSDLHSIIYEYIEKKVDWVAMAALDQFNYRREIPFLKAVFDINIESVEVLLNYPDYPVIYPEWIMRRVLSRIEAIQSLINKGSYKISGRSTDEIRIRQGIERNPGCENPLLKLSLIIKAATAKYLGKTIVGNTPLMEDYSV
jgi:hypothetical protein